MKQKQLLAGISAGLISLGMVGSADAALIGRLAATLGGTDYQAYYDDVANLTWLADANYAQTSGYDDDGRMTWQAANDWAAQLTVDGVGDWRLANTNPVNDTAYNYGFTDNGSTDFGRNVSRSGTAYAGSQGSELANLFYNVLGNVSNYDSSGVFDNGCAGSCLTSTGPFSNVQFNVYWSATEYAPSTLNAWLFNMTSGIQTNVTKDSSFYGWAVQSGDVGSATPAVPVPAAVWLFGSGLLGLVGVARRKSANP